VAGGTARPFFTGPQKLATVDDLDAFVRRAAPEESFVWCEAPAQIHGETKARVTELIGEGLVRHHPIRRAGGGYEFTVFRTRKALPLKLDPVAAALTDPATDLIFRALKRAANFAQPCPSDTDLARAAGLNLRQSAQQKVRKLIDAGLIESTQAYEGGIPTRVVTILPGKHAGAAGGKSTLPPKKWRALQQAAEREMRSSGGPSTPTGAAAAGGAQ
jgi:hypothetical protein